MARAWVRLDVGLLNDDRFESLTPAQLAAWIKSYLLIAREGDAVPDLARLARLLSKEGIEDAAARVDELDRAGWFVAAERGGLTLRGYEQRQYVYAGAHDHPAARIARNARRGDRSVEYAKTNEKRRGKPGGAARSGGGAAVEERRPATRGLRVEEREERRSGSTLAPGGPAPPGAAGGGADGGAPSRASARRLRDVVAKGPTGSFEYRPPELTDESA